MYYKVKQRSETHQNFKKLFEKMEICRKSAFDLAKELGLERICYDRSAKVGGISYFECKGDIPEGFKSVGPKNRKLIYPKKGNIEVIEKIKGLPIVTEEEFNSVINYTYHFDSFNRFFNRSYGVAFRDNVYYINAQFKDNKPTSDDLMEILYSEWLEATNSTYKKQN